MPNGVKKNQINNIINYGLQNLNDLEEWSRNETIKKFNFLSFSNTIKTLHLPKEQEFYNPESNLIKRLAHDELLSNFVSLMVLKNKMQANNSGILDNDLIFFTLFSQPASIIKLPPTSKASTPESFAIFTLSSNDSSYLLSGSINST